MTWTKLDDQLHSHPKVQDAWQACRASLGLHLLAMSHAGMYLTDGRVSQSFVSLHLPSAAERRRATAALVAAGLWIESEDGWVIHDYLKYNDSREKVLARRSADSGRKRGGNGVES